MRHSSDRESGPELRRMATVLALPTILACSPRLIGPAQGFGYHREYVAVARSGPHRTPNLMPFIASALMGVGVAVFWWTLTTLLAQ